MNTFRSVFSTPDSKFRIAHEKPILLMGSCFSLNMESHFADAGFQVLANPFGIQYNPIPIFRVLSRAFSEQEMPDNWIDEVSGSYINWMAHHTHVYKSKDDLVDYFNHMLEQLKKLPDGTTIFITHGTSWYYRLKRNGLIVANCHKLPASAFEKRMAAVEEIVSTGNATLNQMSRFQVIHTVSPVRHLRDGFVENQRSKAALHLSIAEWEKTFENVGYFPSYEWVIDDLRDYRFFKEDLVHPSDQAVLYVWEKLKEMYFSAQTLDLANESEKASRASRHRVMNLESKATREHVIKTLGKIDVLEKKGAHLDVARKRLLNMLPESD